VKFLKRGKYTLSTRLLPIPVLTFESPTLSSLGFLILQGGIVPLLAKAWIPGDHKQVYPHWNSGYIAA
jgi:hypothetical protein